MYPRLDVVVRQPLHHTATLSLSEGRYHYCITDSGLAAPGAPTPACAPAEATLFQIPPTKAAATDLYYVRTAFAEATAQLLGTLQTGLR